MSFIASRLQSVALSETMEMAARAAALRRQGLDVISLSQGEPDFDTPKHIQRAAIAAIHEGKARYTEAGGILALRTAVSAKMMADHGLHYDADQVSITAGAKQAIFNAFFATLEAGDEVIIPAPCWGSYPEIVRLTGGVPVVVQCPAETAFKMTAAQLEASITPRTKWLMLNSPSNPTGAVYSRAEWAALGSVLVRHPQVRILSDDIYEKLVYVSEPFTNIVQVNPVLQERTLVVNGLSKIYCMTGWRIGYAVGPRELIGAMNLVQGQSTNNTNAIAQYAALEALTGDPSCIATFRAAFQERRAFFVEALRRAPGLELDPPDGAFYAFVSCRGLLGKRSASGQRLATDQDVVRYLLDVAQVATVSGTGFLHSPYLRISFASGLPTLQRAADRIVDAVAGLR